MAFLVGVALSTSHGWPLLQDCPDRIDYTADIAEHFRVRHTHDAITFSLEPLVTPRIVRDLLVLGVMPAVDLDNEPPLEAHEVDDIAAERMLPAKARSIDLLGAQRPPQLALTVAHGLAQGSGALVGHAARLAWPRAKDTPTRRAKNELAPRVA